MKSRLATTARAETLSRVRALTPEQRLNAFLQQSQLVTELSRAGAAARHAAKPRRP